MENPRMKRSKWVLKNILEEHDQFRQYIPETRLFNSHDLAEMLEMYKMVYIKPDNWSWGRGVMKVEKIITKRGKCKFRYQSKKKSFTFLSYTELFDAIERSINKKMKKRNNHTYIIQRGIHLLKYNEAIFDFRLMVQLSPKNKYESTGILGRLADPKYIVTNFHSKGTVYPVEFLLKPHMKKKDIKELKKKLYTLGEEIALLFNRKAIGLDIGIDENMDIWIIEINLKPDPFVFKEIDDEKMINKIMQYRFYWKKEKNSKKRDK
ncbi:YheC/YheD family protein [Bacillus sp. FJAT-49705]|uniref:YheC/YheD family protein n=1 Tax=Cytobacillus citreus TaxID=2833586 RepID=A0ABS5NXZ9_9BACI|nr:YheC/YheD family protein [Cytobacillus citreus]MBS4192701.1 YheC/YheD family protein [Cytobacillus citreus]